MNGSAPSEFLILVDKDNKFLAKQYVQAIGTLRAGGLTRIKSIYEPSQSSLALLTAREDTTNIVYVDVFDERAEDYGQFENIIVVCEQVEKSIAKAVADYTITLPKFEDWQIYDYIKPMCPLLEEADLMWLIKSVDCDINRVLNELDKVVLFPKNEQKAVFSAVSAEMQKDLYKVDLFAVVNALVDGNMTALFELLKYANLDTVEPVVLANRAFGSLKNILLASQNPGLTAEDCGMTPGQHRFIKYNYRNLNVEAAKAKLKFLADFDFALKTSKLDLTKHDMLAYLINNLAYKITK
jgi:hypothetical protein